MLLRHCTGAAVCQKRRWGLWDGWKGPAPALPSRTLRGWAVSPSLLLPQPLLQMWHSHTFIHNDHSVQQESQTLSHAKAQTAGLGSIP